MTERYKGWTKHKDGYYEKDGWIASKAGIDALEEKAKEFAKDTVKLLRETSIFNKFLKPKKG